jgi:SAM-dependent methyltransferase
MATERVDAVTRRISLLGRPSIELDGSRAGGPCGRKAWGLLAYAALVDRPPTRQRLGGLLFCEAADPLRALRWNLTQLRVALDARDIVGGDPLELRLADVEHRVIDAERIELDADSVDGVICRFGYMLMADPAAALAETRRVLRGGGRLVLAVWGAPERNPFFALLGATLVERGHLSPPEPGAPGVFAMASAERTRALLADAGFGTVRTEEVPVRFAIAGGREYLAIATDTAGPTAILLRGLSDSERAALEAKLEQALSPFAAGGGYELPGVALAARAS